MNYRVVIAFLLLFVAVPAIARDNKKKAAERAAVEAMRAQAERTPTVVRDPYRGYSWTVDEEGDTMLVVHMRELTVYPPMKFKNAKEEEFFWRTVRDVKLTLPYAKLIAETLIETYEYIETFPTQRERKEYLKKMEDEIFKQYKPVLKKFTKSQAQLLIKLIRRETDQSSYNIIKAFLGSFRAGFWQTFGRFFGVNLKGDYNPDTDRKDAIIERIAVKVEDGLL